jgi:hypothetical protein
VLFTDCLHQPRHAIDIRTVKMGLSRSANNACTMDYGINTVHQTFQAIKVFERTFNPINIYSRKTASIR